MNIFLPITETLFKAKGGRVELISLPPLRLCVNEFCVYNFCCSLTNIIHPTNLHHLVISFEFFGYTLTLCHLFNQAVECIFGITVELEQIII